MHSYPCFESFTSFLHVPRILTAPNQMKTKERGGGGGGGRLVFRSFSLLN